MTQAASLTHCEAQVAASETTGNSVNCRSHMFQTVLLEGYLRKHFSADSAVPLTAAAAMVSVARTNIVEGTGVDAEMIGVPGK